MTSSLMDIILQEDNGVGIKVKVYIIHAPTPTPALAPAPQLESHKDTRVFLPPQSIQSAQRKALQRSFLCVLCGGYKCTNTFCTHT